MHGTEQELIVCGAGVGHHAGTQHAAYASFIFYNNGLPNFSAQRLSQGTGQGIA